MKVALVLSGQPRCLNECFESLNKHIIQPYHPDIFLHFWNTSFATPSQQLNKIWYGKEDPAWQRFDDEYALKWLQIIKPKRFIIDAQRSFDYSYFRDNCTVANSRMQAKSFINVMSMFYSIMQADLCRIEWSNMHGISYDAVLRCRTDLLFHSTPELIHLDKVSIPAELGFGGFNDQFAFGNWQNMIKYANCFNSIEWLFKNGTNFHPETILRDHLKLYDVPVNLIPIPYRIIR